MNDKIAEALSLPLRIAALVVVGVVTYYLVPQAAQLWIKAQAEWAWDFIGNKLK